LFSLCLTLVMTVTPPLGKPLTPQGNRIKSPTSL
jgi:hypothetical protein